jgi:2-polyprenyl-6-hydroxyphenyl methylase/3-demethylubiquinone-9 3-methyltransferase
MKEVEAIAGYEFKDESASGSHVILLPPLRSELKRLVAAKPDMTRRLFDLGCGNGSIGNALAKDGWDVTGVDPSSSGIESAQRAYPHLHLATGSAYQDLVAQYGRFPVVVSLEVVEHVYAPRDYARTLFDLVEPGGTAIVSTPYHGYLKNLALALTGAMDKHFTALWDHGHIKFWSIETLSALLHEAGFVDLEFTRVGRIAPLAKSMVVYARKPVS